MRVRTVVWLSAVLAACSTSMEGGMPARLSDLPWRAGPADAVVGRARALIERGQAEEALPVLEAVLAEQPRHVDARRLRQDVLRERGRRGLLWWEAETALAQAPNEPDELYLFGRIAADPLDKRTAFERAAARAPESLWPWLGLAHTLRSQAPSRSLAMYDRLYGASNGHPLVAIAYGAMLRDAERYDEAAAVYERLRAAPEVPGVGDLGLAQARFAQDRRSEAWPALLAALRVRPFDPAVQGLLSGWIAAGASADQVAQVLDVLREDPDRLRALATGDGEALAAELLLRTLQPQAALSLLEAQPSLARRPALRRLQRRLVLALGDVGAFLQIARADVPMSLVAAETNQLRGRWLGLLQGPWYEGDPLASAERAEALLEALCQVGWLAEVELLAEVVLRRWPTRPAVVAVRDEARRELAFEAGLRRLLYQGYDGSVTGGLNGTLSRIRALSRQVFQRDVVGTPEVFAVAMVGELVDPFRGDLAAHFDRFNRHFVLGARSGGAVEGMLFSRLSSTELPASADLALPARCFEVVVMDRDVRALAGVLGGDVAGVALLNHFLIDHDAVREWARTVADRRAIVAADGNAALADPLPARAGLDPLDAAWRLAVRCPVPDEGLEEAVLDTIRHHERQHLVDAYHYLPIESNLWRSLGVLFQFGLSPTRIESEMERRAELASLAVSEHTELVLAHIADFMGDTSARSPHHQGFGELGREITAELEALGVPAAAAAPSRWHAVDRALIRRAARNLMERL